MLEMRPRGSAAGEHRRDVFDVPRDAGDAAIDVREGPGIRLADFPHEQQGDEFAMVLQASETFGDAATAFVEIGLRPRVRFGFAEFYGGQCGVQIEHRDAAQTAAVDRRGVMAAVAGILPLAVEQIEDPTFGIEGFRRGSAQFLRQRIPLGCRRDDRHA